MGYERLHDHRAPTSRWHKEDVPELELVQRTLFDAERKKQQALHELLPVVLCSGVGQRIIVAFCANDH